MVAEVAEQIRWVIKAFVAGSPDARRSKEFGTDLILVDAPSPGSGEVFDWSLLGEVPEGPRLILAGGLDPDNVADGGAQGAAVGRRRVDRRREVARAARTR